MKMMLGGRATGFDCVQAEQGAVPRRTTGRKERKRCVIFNEKSEPMTRSENGLRRLAKVREREVKQRKAFDKTQSFLSSLCENHGVFTLAFSGEFPYRAACADLTAEIMCNRCPLV